MNDTSSDFSDRCEDSSKFQVVLLTHVMSAEEALPTTEGECLHPPQMQNESKHIPSPVFYLVRNLPLMIAQILFHSMTFTASIANLNSFLLRKRYRIHLPDPYASQILSGSCGRFTSSALLTPLKERVTNS